MIAGVRESALLAALAAVLGGCASAGAPRDAHLGSASPLTIESGLMVRPAAPLPRRGGTDVPMVVCVEPSLDVTLVLADSILARAKAPTGPDHHLIELAEKTRSEAASLRNTLGQLCGAWARHGGGIAGRTAR